MLADQKLVLQFIKTGSEEAFRCLYRSKTPALYRLALHLSRQDKYQAEEAIQEMWVIAIRKLSQFEWRSSLQTWLTGILINVVRKHQFNITKRQTDMDQLSDMNQSVAEPTVFDQYDLQAAINRLADGYQQVLILHDIEGYTHKEIGELLNINEGTSKSQLFRARKAIRIFINEKIKQIHHE